MNEQSPIEFTFESYLSGLMEAMGMEQMSKKAQADMLWQLGRQLGYRLMTALSENFLDNDWTKIQKWDNIKDLQEFVEKTMGISPEVEQAVLKTLDDFWKETLDAFGSFKK